MSETDKFNLIISLEEFIRTPVILYHNYKKGLVILFQEEKSEYHVQNERRNFSVVRPIFLTFIILNKGIKERGYTANSLYVRPWLPSNIFLEVSMI